MKKDFLLRRLLALSTLLAPAAMPAQCNFFDDFSSAAPWTQVGTTVTVANNKGNFNTTPCASDQRIVRQLSPGNATLSNTSWTADVDFVAVQPALSFGVAHSVLCFTSGPLNPYRYTPTGNYTPQDFIEIAYGSPMNTGFSQWKLYASAKDDANAPQSSANGITLPAQNTTYYLRLIRSGTTVTLHAFSDAARTVALAGSPVTLTIPNSIGWLSHVQVGSVIQGGGTRRLSGSVDNICVTGITNGGNCDVWYDYSTVGNWQQVSTGVSVSSGTVTFANAADGQERRIYHSLNGALLGVNTWRADFDFLPTAVGTGGPGHVLFGATAGTQDPISGNSPYPATNQDGILATWGSTNHTNNPATFMLDGRAKNDNGPWSTSTPNILLVVGTQYYITLERLDEFTGRISAYTDAARTQHVANSPQCFTIPPGVTGLTHAQHGTVPWGGFDRALTGTVDNTCIKALPINPGTISTTGTTTFCGSGTPTLLDNSSSATGGSWNWTYQWEKSVGCNGVWTSIAGATNATYQPGQLTTTTCFRRRAYGPCGVSVVSNTLTFTVYQPLTASISSVQNGSGSTCNATFTLTANVNDPQGVTYLWSTGQTTSSINVGNPYPNGPVTYTVTATSPCYSTQAYYTVYPCYSPSYSFPVVSVSSWFCVNWSGNCTGSCFFQVTDPNFAIGAGPAYNATKIRLRIFDRWGIMLYEKTWDQNDYPNCGGLWNGIVTWDGIYQGNPVQIDEYVWQLYMENCTMNQTLTGTVLVAGHCRLAGEEAQDSSTAITEPAIRAGVYPNPSEGTFHINYFNPSQTAPAQLIVTDALGREVRRQEIQPGTSTAEVLLDDQPAGMYYLRIIDGGHTLIEKLMVE